MTTPVRLGDVCRITTGFPFKSQDFTEAASDLRLLRGDNIVQGKLRWTGAKHLPLSLAGNASQYNLLVDDIVIAMDRPWIDAGLKWARLLPSDLPCLLVQRVARLRAVDGVTDQRFLGCVIASRQFTDYILGTQTGTAVPHISARQIMDFRFNLPPVYVQVGIANCVTALDDKIELNRRMNETLEAMARALFRSWFVDFDPVRAKSEGRPTGLPADLDILFPSEFEDSILGEIPKSWRAGTVSDVAGMGRQQVNPGDAPDEVFAHFSIPAFDAGRNPILEVGFAIKSNKLVVTPGSILVSKLNPHIPRVWLTDVDPAYRAVGSTEFFVLQAKAPHSSAFLYSLMSSPEFAVDLQTLVTGTSNSHQRVQPEAFMSYSLVVPSDETATAFESLAKPLLDQVLANRKEMAQLAKTRDGLLPRLLSGEIEVAEAEVEES